MTQSTLPGTGPWSWLEPGLWVYRSRELDLLGQADGLLADAAPAAQQGGSALLEAKRRLHAAGVGAATAPASVGGGGHRYVVQVGIQFLAGYRDLTLRDVAHVGHGALLAQDPDWHGRAELAGGDPRRAGRAWPPPSRPPTRRARRSWPRSAPARCVPRTGGRSAGARPGCPGCWRRTRSWCSPAARSTSARSTCRPARPG